MPSPPPTGPTPWPPTGSLPARDEHLARLEVWITHMIAQRQTGLDFAALKWGGPTGAIDTKTRREQARWLLHDDTVEPEDRVAGLLVLLYAQPVSRGLRRLRGNRRSLRRRGPGTC